MSKKYTPREAAIMVLQKAEELYKLSTLAKARVDEGKNPQTKAWDRSARNDRTGTNTTTWKEPPGPIGKILGKPDKETTQVHQKTHEAVGNQDYRRGSQATPGHAPKTSPLESGGTVTSARKVVGTPSRTPDYPKSSFKYSNAVGKSEEAPMKGHIKLAKFVGRMEAKRGKPMDKAEDPLTSVAGDRMKRAAGYKESGDKLSNKIANEGAKESHEKRLQGIKEAPKPKLPG